MNRTMELMRQPEIRGKATTLIREALDSGGERINENLLAQAIEKAGIVERLLDELHARVLPLVVAQAYLILQEHGEVTDRDTLRLTRVVADAVGRDVAEGRLAPAA